MRGDDNITERKTDAMEKAKEDMTIEEKIKYSKHLSEKEAKERKERQKKSVKRR